MPSAGYCLQDRWMLGEPLGEGGFATVYRAQRVDDGLPAAVKILRPAEDGYTRETIGRFQREVDLLGRLDDQYTVKLIDHGRSASGLLYLVCELVEGRDLSEILQEQRPLPDAIVRHILTQGLLSLRAAHRNGLLHRDIKPENLRVFRRGDDPWAIKLLDFGIARDATQEEGGKLTATGLLVGTPRYMSPEQLRSQPLTFASDIYSLGVVAYEMLVDDTKMHGRSLGAQLVRLTDEEAFVLPPGEDPRLRRAIAAMVRPSLERRVGSAEAALHLLSLDPEASSARSGQDHTAVRQRHLVPRALVLVSVAVAAIFAVTSLLKDGDAGDPGALPIAAPVPRHPVPQDPPAPMDDYVDAGRVVGAPLVGCDSHEALEYGRYDIPTANGEPALVYLPRDYGRDTRYPVIMLFHDQFSKPEIMLDASKFEDLADAHGFVLLAPRDQPMSSTWTSSDASRMADAFEALSGFACIDASNVFAASTGRGGRMAERFPCWVSGARGMVIAGFRSSELEHGRACEKDLPYLHIESLQDPQLPPDGGKTCVNSAFGSAQSSVVSLAYNYNRWQTQHRCSEAEPTRFGGTDEEPCLAWDCEVAFVSCQLKGGRKWSRGSAMHRSGGCTRPPSKFDLTPILVKFFRANMAAPSDGGRTANDAGGEQQD